MNKITELDIELIADMGHALNRVVTENSRLADKYHDEFAMLYTIAGCEKNPEVSDAMSTLLVFITAFMDPARKKDIERVVDRYRLKVSRASKEN